MEAKLYRTSCKFRQVPVGRLRMIVGLYRKQAANDNSRAGSPGLDATPAAEAPSLSDVGPILSLVAISAATFYLVSNVLCGYLRSFPAFYP